MLFPSGSRKQMIDEALVNMIIKDSQPFSLVEDEGFSGLIHALDPTYVLPSRQVCVEIFRVQFNNLHWIIF